jgi:tRNA modification GTPase
LPVVFVDTAGLREAADGIEKEGIRRSHEIVSRAELILHVFDGSEPFGTEDAHYLERFASAKRIVVRNKIDLPTRLTLPAAFQGPLVEVCSLTGQGIEELRDTIQQLFWAGSVRAEMLEVMINARHQDALRRAREAMSRTLESMQAGLALDLVALDLRIAVQAVGEIVGQTATDDLLDSIFSQFCIGK